MKKNFNKNDYRDTDKIIKVIIDTDPGVDDTACLIYAFFDKNIDVKLLTTVAGNVGVDKTTRNLLHLLDLFNIDIPVSKGAERALKRVSPTAEFIHQADGLGGYIPPKDTIRKVLESDAVESMYQVIMQGDGDIVPIMLGPQTNIARLIERHPDVVKKIPRIVCMGGSPFGHPDYPDHISFNLSSDPDAFKVVLDSGIPILLIPSNIGRYKAHLGEEFVYSLKDYNDVGKLLFLTYSKHWEPKCNDKRITTNDTCALLSLVYPKMFKFEKVSVTVDVEKDLGKTFMDFHSDGKVDMVTDIDRQAFIDFLVTELEKMKDIKLDIKVD